MFDLVELAAEADRAAVRGATWLDEHCEARDGQPWFNRVDLNSFNIESGFDCVIGQLYGLFGGNIYDVVRQVCPEAEITLLSPYADVLVVAREYGWMWPAQTDFSDGGFAAYRAYTDQLDAAWRREILARRNR